MTNSDQAAPVAPIRVLLVDDEPLLRRSLSIAIAQEPDLDVVGEAGTGKQAVQQVDRLRPDVVLMDIRMPDGNGITATQEVTQNPVHAATKVIVLTMFEMDDYGLFAVEGVGLGVWVPGWGSRPSDDGSCYTTNCRKASTWTTLSLLALI